jgi:hypothetical protein
MNRLSYPALWYNYLSNGQQLRCRDREKEEKVPQGWNVATGCDKGRRAEGLHFGAAMRSRGTEAGQEGKRSQEGDVRGRWKEANELGSEGSGSAGLAG